MHEASVPTQRWFLFFANFLLFLPSLHEAAWADVALASIFSDHMVVQRDRELPIWGTAGEGEDVTVTLGDQTAITKAVGGKWMVKLKAFSAGGPLTLTVTGKNTITVSDILVGEVWICSGQSNMAWTLKDTQDAGAAIASANDPQLRLITIPRVAKDQPQETFEGSWAATTPESVTNFSAVAYYFGKHLRETLGVPIGLINTSFGGTPAEAWTSQQKLKSSPELENILKNYQQAIEQYPMALAKFQEESKQYEEAKRLAKEGEKPAPLAPRAPVDPASNPQRPTGLFNAMIHPLIPFAIRGAIWYQGESNASRAYEYSQLFPAMISDWRERWGQGDFPFLFVQLAPFMLISNEPGESDWAELREAQRLTLKNSPQTGMAVITDVGEERDIHPRKKREVGDRLALLARKIAHGEDVVADGPTFKQMTVEGDKAILSFDNLGGGLVSHTNGPLTGFTIAGEDKKFHNATAEIVGETVVVSSPEVKSPVAVRMGWANFPVVNLWNKAGLPASPFRTDEFPWTTAR